MKVRIMTTGVGESKKRRSSTNRLNTECVAFKKTNRRLNVLTNNFKYPSKSTNSDDQ